jgi:SAM-dependent methyltransferase
MHIEAYEFVRSALAGQYGSVIEVGGRNINGGVRDLVKCDSYTSIDLFPGPAVDVVADCREWAPDEPADLVICCEVLEHADDPEGVVAACISYLSPTGRLAVTCAGPSREPHSTHDGGALRGDEHYGNIDADDLDKWMADLNRRVVYGRGTQDVYAVGWRG